MIDVFRVIAELRADLANVNGAIASLEYLESIQKRTRRQRNLRFFRDDGGRRAAPQKGSPARARNRAAKG